MCYVLLKAFPVDCALMLPFGAQILTLRFFWESAPYTKSPQLCYTPLAKAGSRATQRVEFRCADGHLDGGR